eukprot:6052789-Amphidinium_carterae.1
MAQLPRAEAAQCWLDSTPLAQGFTMQAFPSSDVVFLAYQNVIEEKSNVCNKTRILRILAHAYF